MEDPILTHLLRQNADHAEQGGHATDPLVLQLLRRCIAQNEQILDEHVGIKDAFASHVANEESLVRGLIGAFPKKPDGSPDLEGHEAYHSTLIEESRARTVFYRELQHELIKKSLQGLGLVLVALVAYWWTGQTHVVR